jgi:hypothetical protein
MLASSQPPNYSRSFGPELEIEIEFEIEFGIDRLGYGVRQSTTNGHPLPLAPAGARDSGRSGHSNTNATSQYRRRFQFDFDFDPNAERLPCPPPIHIVAFRPTRS